MRKPIVVIVAALLSLTMIPFAVQAQEASCDIDVQDVVSTLIEAQTLAAQGNTTDAQAKLADAQAALDALAAVCSGQTLPVELTQTFVAPDEVLSFDYPKGWVIGEYDATSVEGGTGGNAIFASNESVFKNIDKQPEEWTFASGDVFAYAGVGSPAVILRDAGVFTSEANITDAAGLDELVNAFQSGLVAQNETFSVGKTESFSLNDRKAASFVLNSSSFSGVVVLIELEKGKFGVALGIGPTDEAAQIATTVKVIAASVR